MAEERRGGRRVPRNPASYSGVGKNSKRTDGRIQPKRAPNIQDSTDLQQGERAIIEAGQNIAPLRGTPAPRIAPPTGGGRSMVGPSRGGMPPDHLMGIPSARPGEPETAGLALGRGPGPEVLTPQQQDDREIVLGWLAAQPNAPQAIIDMQNDIRNARMAPQQPPRAPMGRPEPMPEDVPREALPDEEIREEEVPLEEQEEPSPIEPTDDEMEDEPVV